MYGEAPLYRPLHWLPYSVKTGGENDIIATATSGMALPRVTRGNGYNISGPCVQFELRVCATASSHDLAPFTRGLTLTR